MEQNRTELEWIYRPGDFFETRCDFTGDGYSLRIDAGQALATLHTPIDPVPTQLEEKIADHVKILLLARQLQVHRVYEAEGPRISYYQDGRKRVSLQLTSNTLNMTGGVDVVQTDESGRVVRDTRLERIALEQHDLQRLIEKARQVPTVRAVLESYGQGVADPKNELVHLYEVREALATHFGSELNARTVLAISKAKWQRIGDFANNQPFEQGRHRGKHPNRRSATDEELGEARQLVSSWIRDFVRAL
jgi:hypothetical protein